MLPDHKSRCPSMAPLLQPQRRKYLIGGIIVFISIVVILVVIFILTSHGKKSFVLDRTPLFAGRNNLPQNIYNLVGGNLSAVDLNSDLTSDTIFGRNCPQCNTDIPRLKKGRVSSQFWIARAGCNESAAILDTIDQLDLIDRMIKKYSDNFQSIKNSADVAAVFENKKIGGLIAIDGGQSLINSTSFLRTYYSLGVRALTLAYGCNDSTLINYIESNNTLTAFGEAAIAEMNRLGMIIDAQGLPSDVQAEILNITTAPIMFSHTAAFDLYSHSGNINNVTLFSLKSNNGLVMITFDSSNFGSQENITIADVVKHLNYIVDVIGFDNVAIGGNYDSMDEKPTGLEDVSDFPELFKTLKADNSNKWTAENLDKLAGLNFKNFLQNVESAKTASAA